MGCQLWCANKNSLSGVIGCDKGPGGVISGSEVVRKLSVQGNS